MPGKTANPVFSETWYDAWPEGLENAGGVDWHEIYRIREAVNQALEISRKAGVMGSALAADVLLYVDDTTKKILGPLGNELRFVLITSGAQLLPLAEKPKEALETDIPGLAVLIKPSDAPKCVRCWHRAPDMLF